MRKNLLCAGLLVATVFFLVSGCSLFWGKRLEFNGGELYYTSSVTREEADRLGDYLVEAGFYDGNEKTAQLTKTGTTYEFRMVVKKGIDEDEEFIGIAKNYPGMFLMEVRLIFISVTTS